MSPAAAKSSKPDIVLLANANGELKDVKPKAETKKAPARRRSTRATNKDLSAAADELLAAADQAKKAAAGETAKPAAKKAATKKKATTKKASTTSKATTTKAAKKTTTKKAAESKAKVPEIVQTPEEKAKAAAAEKEAKAKALASIKIGPKGVYTEDSIRVYLQEIGRIRLLRPDEEIELARKIADLLHLEELAAQFESDNGREPDNKEWAALVNATHPVPSEVDAGPTGQGRWCSQTCALWFRSPRNT